MSLIHLSTELRQELKLTPQLLQSMELLQMNSQELLDYLNQVSEENPLVEQTDLSSLHKAYEALRQKVHWINGGLPEDGHGAMPDRGAADRETESLSAFLCDQLERRRLPKPLLALTRYLAELVDEEGRLSQEDLDGVADLKIPQALTQQALETLQSLDPAGVGARSLSECLLLQLARQDAPSPLDMEIVRRFLPDLGKKHYSLIARELHTTPEEVRAAEKRISALDPCPGRSFQPAEPTLYVRPDLFIAELDGKLQVILNDYYLPRVSISQYYVRLLKESDEPETRAYLQQKMQQAKWLLNSLERRGSTLRQCAEAILETQRAFFAGQTTELVPMTMVTLAERLHLHPSTVSRATREKYLQCRQGTYPLRYFFSRALGEQGPSQQTVKLRLLELIRQEDHSRPLSDQKLAELLERRLAGEPVAYLIGEWEFYGLPLNISQDVLIPRMDTEVLAERAILLARAAGEGARVLDLCAGSGCVGLAVAANVPGCRVVLADVSEAALRLCKQNVRRNELNARVTCVQADALEPPDAALWDFDVIACNPPYIPTGDIAGLDVSVRDYEPRSALDGGADGLDFYRAIAARWGAALRLGGALLFEVGIGQAGDVGAILAQNQFEQIQTFQDTQGIGRVVEGVLNS